MYVSFVYSVYNTMCIRMCYVRPHTPTHTRTHTHTYTHTSCYYTKQGFAIIKFKDDY